MPKQNINSIRTYIKVSTLFTMTAKPLHIPGYGSYIMALASIYTSEITQTKALVLCKDHLQKDTKDHC